MDESLFRIRLAAQTIEKGWEEKSCNIGVLRDFTAVIQGFQRVESMTDARKDGDISEMWVGE